MERRPAHVFDHGRSCEIMEDCGRWWDEATVGAEWICQGEMIGDRERSREFIGKIGFCLPAT